MVFLIAVLGAAIVTLVLWRMLSAGVAPQPEPPVAPDDDPEFLRQLDERLRRED